jgi:hypothetical protein
MLIFAVISKMKIHIQKEEFGWQCFLWVSIFILDFVSSWFRVYSIYLAGPRTEKVSNGVENLVLSIYRKKIVGNFIITLLAEIWVSTFVFQYSSKGSSLNQFYVQD